MTGSQKGLQEAFCRIYGHVKAIWGLYWGTLLSGTSLGVQPRTEDGPRRRPKCHRATPSDSQPKTVYRCIHTYLRRYLCLYIYIYNIYECTCACIIRCMHEYMHVYVLYIHLSLCLHIHMCIYIYMCISYVIICTTYVYQHRISRLPRVSRALPPSGAGVEALGTIVAAEHVPPRALFVDCRQAPMYLYEGPYRASIKWCNGAFIVAVAV